MYIHTYVLFSSFSTSRNFSCFANYKKYCLPNAYTKYNEIYNKKRLRNMEEDTVNPRENGMGRKLER